VTRFCVASYEKCKPMDSKMRPLWLVWKNAELAAGAKEFESLVMFKKGDGQYMSLVLSLVVIIIFHLLRAPFVELIDCSSSSCPATGLSIICRVDSTTYLL